MITETDEVARALDAAAEEWPEDRDHRSRLVLHLLEEGGRAVGDRHRRAAEERAAAVERTSGLLTGAYERDYLKRLRRDWPE